MCILYPAIVCESRSEGLVRYPTTFGGSVATLQCADNAHSNNSSMLVLCESTGIWTAHSPAECLCDEGYRTIAASTNESVCEGEV